jgi:ketosteroid isomerase-like protein
MIGGKGMAASTFEEAVEQHHRALDAFMTRDTEPFKALFTRQDDATLANPFGGIARGWREIPTRLDTAAANYAEGEIVSIETIATAATSDLGYTVEIERLRAKVGERGTVDSVALRTTSVLRREGNEWRLVHRHADPLVELQAAESIVRG